MSGRPSPVKSSKMQPPARSGPRAIRPTWVATFSNRPRSRFERNGSTGDQEPRRDLLRIIAERHGGDVEQPADAQVAGPLVEIRGEPSDRLARARRPGVDRRGGDREDAARRADAADAVILLAPAQGVDAEQGHHVRPDRRRHARRPGQFQRPLEPGRRLVMVALVERDERELPVDPEGLQRLIQRRRPVEMETIQVRPEPRPWPGRRDARSPRGTRGASPRPGPCR